MPFIPHTPESLLRRSDSKNPATTCKGITTSGTHCRRSINTSPKASLPFHRRNANKRDGVLAVLEPGDDDDHEGAAAFFCWQHKDQAAILTAAPPGGRKAKLVDLQRRTSVDTLAERLGVLDVDDQGKPRRQRRNGWERERPARKDTLPKKWQDVEGPLLAVHGRRTEKSRNKPSALTALCCFSTDSDRLPSPRVEKYNEKRPHAPIPNTARMPPHPSRNPVRHETPTSITIHRPRPPRDPSSQTQTLLSLIPPTLDPQTTSLLLAELAKPVSPADEAGYIYMFWLTPQGVLQRDTTTIISSFLADEPNTPRGGNGRRRRSSKSENIPRKGNTAEKKENTLLLKIGRASNVQRRMNEWTRQCGYDLSLIRFYPYLPTSSAQKTPSPLPSPRREANSAPTSPPSPSPAAPQKVPHAHKVERLIHIELADKRVKRGCEACGKEHREWFEVEGTREGVRGVDGAMRRWVRWAEGR